MKKYLCLIIFLLFLSACYKETQPAVSDVIKSLSAPASAPADGASTVNIVAQIPGKTQPGMYSLTFFSTAGLFYDTQKSSTTITSLRPATNDGNRTATAILVCPADTGTAVVTVTAVDISSSVTIKFTPALPQTVKASVSAQFVTVSTATNEVTLSLNLIRSTGIVTQGTIVQASATDTLGNPVGNFRNGSTVLSDKTGNATFNFSPNQTLYRGTVILKAWVPGTNPLLSDSQNITLL